MQRVYCVRRCHYCAQHQAALWLTANLVDIRQWPPLTDEDSLSVSLAIAYENSLE